MAGWLVMAFSLGACQSQQQKTEQARQTAQSLIAGISLTCSEWRNGHVPEQFASRAVRAAHQQLQKPLGALPAGEQARAQSAARAADCFSRAAGQP